jgi:DnaJ-class molecular chaperone
VTNINKFNKILTNNKKGIKFTRDEKCHSCNGMRAAKGSRPSKCFACNATGEIKSKLNKLTK